MNWCFFLLSLFFHLFILISILIFSLLALHFVLLFHSLSLSLFSGSLSRTLFLATFNPTQRNIADEREKLPRTGTKGSSERSVGVWVRERERERERERVKESNVLNVIRLLICQRLPFDPGLKHVLSLIASRGPSYCVHSFAVLLTLDQG